MTVRINPDGSTSPVGGSMELWWRTDDGRLHDHVFDMVSMLQMTDSDRFKRNVQALRLYGSRDADSFFPQQYNNILSPAMPEARTKYNIICSMVDTVTSKIGKMKPRISYLTTGGRWDEQMRARNLTKWTDGIFYKNDIYTLHQRMFRAGGIFDAGVLKHYISSDNRIVSEQVVATELLVDPMDAMYGKPSHIYHVKYMRREDLIEEYPEKEAQIKQAKGYHKNELRADDKLDTHVQVVEAWRLPSGPEADDGRHVICVPGVTLVDEGWEKDYFPFTFFHWAPPVVGFWGQSLADRLTGNQLEINKMLRIIQKSFHLGSAFKVFLEYGSKVAREHLNNEIGSIVYYNGQKPEFYVPQTVHPEFFQFLEWLIQSSYEEAGISQLSASSRKPAELESGRALREYNLIETERFATVAQAYEKCFMDTAKIYLDLAAELYEEDVDLEMTVGTKKLVESIRWSDIDVGKDDYIMKMYPTSMLPTEPAGRIATIEGWINSGLIPPEEGLRLLDFPDIEDYRSLKDSPIDLLHLILNDMLYKGKYRAPEPYMDLGRGIGFMQDALQRAMIDEAPENRLQLLRDWIEQARTMMQSAQEAQMAAQADIQAQANMGAQPAEQGVAVENTPGPTIQGV